MELIKNKLIIYIIIGVILFLFTSLFVKQCEIDRLQIQVSKQDFKEFQEKIVIANKKIRNLQIINKTLSKDLVIYEGEFDMLKINNKSIEGKLKAKKVELKKLDEITKDSMELSEDFKNLLKKKEEIILLHEENEYSLKLTIKNLIKQNETLKKQKQYEFQMKIHYENLYLDCSGKYQELYKLKFKPDNKYKIAAIGEAVLFIAILILK